MTDKEVRHLRRSELVEILYHLQQENEALREEVETLRKEKEALHSGEFLEEIRKTVREAMHEETSP